MFLLQTVFGIDHSCLGMPNSTPNSTTPNELYVTNLNELSTYLNYEISSTGFALGTKGQGADKVYGVALCRGDLSDTDCKYCIFNATYEIRLRCPNYKGAIMWNDACTFKYTNADFFGKIDHENWIFEKNPQNLSEADQSITQRKGDWLSKLAGQASGTPQMFSSGELDLGNNSKLYGCTRDLLSIDCSKSLNDSIGFLPKCCDMASGVHMYSGTCNVRFETFKYYNA
jgi:hypothetical protein